MKFREVRFKENVYSPVDASQISSARIKHDPNLREGQVGGQYNQLMESIEERGEWLVLASPKGEKRWVPRENIRDAAPLDEPKPQTKKGAEA